MRSNTPTSLKDLVIVIKGAGEIATGIACRLHKAQFKKILMLDIQHPLAVRRQVSFCEAIHETTKSVEGIEAVKVKTIHEVEALWKKNKIPVLIDPVAKSLPDIKPHVLIDAILAKKNKGTSKQDAQWVIALGPGFEAKIDAHVLVETNRGHNLGRLIFSGKAEPDTGIPGNIEGYTHERVLRASASGVFESRKEIGEEVTKNDVIGTIEGTIVSAQINGILRGLIKSGTFVRKSLKIGDIDPRNKPAYCNSISDKAQAIGGAVLESILFQFNR